MTLNPRGVNGTRGPVHGKRRLWVVTGPSLGAGYPGSYLPANVPTPEAGVGEGLLGRQLPLAQLDALGRDEHPLAHPNAFGRDLHQLVVLDKVQAFFQRHLPRRDELDGGVLSGRAHVGLLLLLGGIDVDIAASPVEPDDHALVDLRAGADKGKPALLYAL